MYVVGDKFSFQLFTHFSTFSLRSLAYVHRTTIWKKCFQGEAKGRRIKTGGRSKISPKKEFERLDIYLDRFEKIQWESFPLYHLHNKRRRGRNFFLHSPRRRRFEYERSWGLSWGDGTLHHFFMIIWVINMTEWQVLRVKAPTPFDKSSASLVVSSLLCINQMTASDPSLNVNYIN